MPDEVGATARRGWPVLPSLAGYRPVWLKHDVSAGIAIAAVGLPSAIAYPAIAGLPPETGIYASIAPLIAYALFGPSRQLIVGPDAATISILAAVLASVFTAGAVPPAERVAVAAALSIGVGLFCLLARLLKLGILATFLSRPILTGFLAGVSISILIGQIGRITGVTIEADGLVAPLLELLSKIGSVHLPTLGLAAAMFALLQVAQLRRFPIPGSVLVIIVSAVLSAVFDFEGHGIRVVGDLPAALPELGLPSIIGLPIEPIILGAAAIFLVSFGSGIVTAQSFGVRAGYAVDPDRELLGFGVANLAAGLTGAFPVSASDSRTAVNQTVGGRTQLASILAALVLALAVLFLAPVLRIIPLPALGAILAATALGLIDLKALRRLWRISRMEFVFAVIAMAGPVGLGVLDGVMIAIGATLVYVLHKLMYPRDALLGRVPGRDGFYKLHRTPEARPVPGLGIYLLEGSLLFFNADYAKSRIESVAAGLPEGTRFLLIDAGAMPQIDSTAADTLAELRQALAARGIRLAFAELHGEVRDLMQRAGLVTAIGPDLIFDNLEDGCRSLMSRQNAE